MKEYTTQLEDEGIEHLSMEENPVRLVSWNELPTNDVQDWFDYYVTEEERDNPVFFFAFNQWHDYTQFEKVENDRFTHASSISYSSAYVIEIDEHEVEIYAGYVYYT